MASSESTAPRNIDPLKRKQALELCIELVIPLQHQVGQLVANGVDIRTVADRAGHSDSVLTLRLYAHALEAQRKRAAIPLEDLLGDARGRLLAAKPQIAHRRVT